MIPVRIDIRGAAELARAWAEAPDLVAEELTRATWEAELLLQREIQDRTPTGATGLLRESISTREPRRLDRAIIGEVGTSIAHAVPVELGTRPHFPPIAPLQDWAEAKLGLDADAARGAAFAIARTIARRGTKGAFMFQHGFARARAQVVQMYDQALLRIRNRLAGARA